MIKINKSINVPSILSGTGMTETSKLKRRFDANPHKYRSRIGTPVRNIKRMKFDNKIYGDEHVKKKLISDQHSKCCFCEAIFKDNSYGDVEHYRPKGAYKAAGARKFTYPGYYWLAYDWNNLMYSCEKCNRKYKKNNFPLSDESKRVQNHRHANLLLNEDCLLINPIQEDPSLFITFNKEVPVPIKGDIKGATSIKAYGLERLNDSRWEYLEYLKCALTFNEIDVANSAQVNLAMNVLKITKADLLEKINIANRLFNFVATDKAKFALCVRSNFPNLPTI